MINNKTNYALGNLEAEIMEAIWKLNAASVRQVLDQLKKKRPLAYTTVMTVMGRLADKGLLSRRLQADGAYQYQPAQKKDDFLIAVSKQAANNLIKSFGEVAVAQFIDAVESSDLKNLAAWREKLKKIA